ncbi:Hsp70 family protein [Micromonospora sp. NPDC005413]|uniref:Hsp70 family protein n=1 Tax=Micromonospora sp. NPDC005413 TaxID=3154563 RepID=UPI0033A76453
MLASDGTVLTGHAALRAAGADPGRFVPAPRRSPEQSVTVAGVQVDPLDLVAAPLRRVGGEVQRVVGGPVEDVRLVVPAGWGPRRRTWMRHAAHRAGLPQPRLVEAPVAVAGFLLATGTQLPVGSLVAVCDVGGGAEVSVLRRGPAGFEVLATLSDPDAGGTAIDGAVSAALAAVTALPAPPTAAASGSHSRRLNDPPAPLSGRWETRWAAVGTTACPYAAEGDVGVRVPYVGRYAGAYRDRRVRRVDDVGRASLAVACQAASRATPGYRPAEPRSRLPAHDSGSGGAGCWSRRRPSGHAVGW